MSRRFLDWQLQRQKQQSSREGGDGVANVVDDDVPPCEPLCKSISIHSEAHSKISQLKRTYTMSEENGKKNWERMRRSKMPEKFVKEIENARAEIAKLLRHKSAKGKRAKKTYIEAATKAKKSVRRKFAKKGWKKS